MTGTGAWREADRLDRERYVHPSRGCAAPVGHDIRGSGTSHLAPLAQQGTHYALLGIERRASAQEVRRAYRRLLVTVHPDKGGLREQFEHLQAAYAVLSNPEQRLIYDDKLDIAGGCTTSNGSSSSAAAAAGQAAAVGCKVQRGTKGVTAVVHGQRQGTPLHQKAQPPRAAAHTCSADSTCELAASTAAILALRTEQGRLDAAALAAAHLKRAALYSAAGQLHHAIFDAEEAVRLQPDIQEAARLASQLAAALEAGGQAQQRQCSGNRAGSRSSDSDVDDPF